MLRKLPSNIPKFEGKVGEDHANHIMSFHLWCSLEIIIEYFVCLRPFQRTLMGLVMKWYVNEPIGTYTTFEKISKEFLSFFDLDIWHDTRLDIYIGLHQFIATHITNHIHEWL